MLNHDPAYSHLAAFSAQPKTEAMPADQDLLAVEKGTTDDAQSQGIRANRQKIAANARRSQENQKQIKTVTKALARKDKAVSQKDMKIFKLEQDAKDNKILSDASLANQRFGKAVKTVSQLNSKMKKATTKDVNISDQLTKEAHGHSKAADDLIRELDRVKTQAQLNEWKEKHEAEVAQEDAKRRRSMTAHDVKIHNTAEALKEVAEKLKSHHTSKAQASKLIKAAQDATAATQASSAPKKPRSPSVHDQISKARAAARTAERAIETEQEQIRQKNRANHRVNMEHARNLADHERALARLQAFIRRLRHHKSGHRGHRSVGYGYHKHSRNDDGHYNYHEGGYDRIDDYGAHFDMGYGGQRDYGVNPPGYDEATVVRREGRGELSDPIRRYPLEERAIHVAQRLAKSSQHQLREAIEETRITRNRVLSTLRRARRAAITRAHRARRIAATKWEYAVNQGGRSLLKPPASDHTMSSINKAMAVIDETAPPQSEEKKAKT